jgi:hypothetical protein
MQTQPDPPRPTWNGNIEVDAQRVPPATAMRLKPAPSRNGEWGDVVKPGSVRTGPRQADWYSCDGRRREERRLETPFAGGRRWAQAVEAFAAMIRPCVARVVLVVPVVPVVLVVPVGPARNSMAALTP